MRPYKIKTLAFFLLLPVLIFLGVGGWAMYQAGYALWVWLLWPVCWGIAFVLARIWRTRLLPFRADDAEPASHWTPRDEDAWELVRQRMSDAETLPKTEFTGMELYVGTAQEMATELSRVYHPNAKDPVTSLTIPEILAAAELALEDLAELVEKYVPAGHLMTIKNWQRLSKLPEQYDKISPWTWAAAALIAPVATAGRYALSRTVISPLTDVMQGNMLVWFFQRYIEKTGYYLIEMNSGRLRGGAKRFRRHTRPGSIPPIGSSPGAIPEPNAETLKTEAATEHPAGETVPEPASVTIAVVGQVGSGKSELIEALTRDHAGDHLTESMEEPHNHGDGSTDGGVRHAITLPDSPVRITFLDTRGYGGSEVSESEFITAEEAFSQADLVLFTLKANSPAREPDARFLEQLRAWFARKPDLKFPPVLGVITQIDLLAPVMEWDPPYHWEDPSTGKERSIHDAMEYAAEILGDRLVGLVPVAAKPAAGTRYGIDEFLIPVMLTQMKEAQSVALLRGLESELGSGQYRRVFEQFWNVGSQLLKASLKRES